MDTWIIGKTYEERKQYEDYLVDGGSGEIVHINVQNFTLFYKSIFFPNRRFSNSLVQFVRSLFVILSTCYIYYLCLDFLLISTATNGSLSI